MTLFPNLRLIGTVNIDETTHGFADKVFDRAQVVELQASREALAEHIGRAEWTTMALDVWDIVKDVAPFGFRVVDEFKAYVNLGNDLGVNWQTCMDEQLVQKVLPRIRGAEPRVKQALESLVEKRRDVCPLTCGKAVQMLHGLENHGFASYF